MSRAGLGEWSAHHGLRTPRLSDRGSPLGLGDAGDRSVKTTETECQYAPVGARSAERLSPEARRLIESGDNIVGVASYWEVVIKGHKGLLTIPDLPSWWRRATELTSAKVLPVRASHVTALATLPSLHKDPFDRILIAQALAEGVGFVTNDEPIQQYPVQTIGSRPRPGAAASELRLVQQRTSATTRLGLPCHELSGRDDLDTRVAAKRQKICVAGDDGLGITCQCCGQHPVVVRVAADGM